MVKATGRLRHHFWGEYHATIVLAFDDEGGATDALRVLGDGWERGKSSRTALVWFGNGEAFERVRLALQTFGFKVPPCGRNACREQCERASIDSVAHSIDLGPEFTVEIPTVAHEQVSLFG